MKTKVNECRWMMTGLLVWLAAAPLAQAFYNPAQGRWLNRDPKGEGKGKNLFLSVGNAAITKVDPLGLEFVDGGKTGTDFHHRYGYTGAQGNQRMGTIQENIPPVINGTCPIKPGVKATCWVRRGTGKVKVVRSFTGVAPGWQGTPVETDIGAGKIALIYPGYYTVGAALAVDQHEMGHIAISATIYAQTIALAEAVAQAYTYPSFLRFGDTFADCEARLLNLLEWGPRLTAFTVRDVAENQAYDNDPSNNLTVDTGLYVEADGITIRSGQKTEAR